MIKDYYKILGISENATDEQIKAAYRSMAMQWHPDKNPDKDTTEKMKEINEAYTILSNPDSKRRYDGEYSYFKYAYSATKSSNTEDYDIKDEELKRDVHNARTSAEEFVRNFYANFKADTKTAAKGAWDGAKPYLIAAGIMAIIGIFVAMGGGLGSYSTHEPEVIKPVSYEVQNTHTIPDDWRTFEFGDAFKISVPPTVELRSDNDDYTKALNHLNLNINEDNIIFQQAGLSKQDPNAQKQYCRIMIEYMKGDYGDFMKSTETETLDSEWKSLLQDFVTGSIGPYSKQMGTTQYKWVTINGAKAIQLDYKRTGANFDSSIPVVCRVGIFQNSNEMIKVILSYRENESNIWADDFKDVFETIEWI